MRLIRFGEAQRERPGVELEDGHRLDLSWHIQDYTPQFFAAGGMERLRHIVAEGKRCPPAPMDARLGPPVANPGKFLAIGLNYHKHAEEVGAKLPTVPEVFTKQVSCICGPNDEVWLPEGSTKLDYEVELAFVIGKRLSYQEADGNMLDYVAGYLICNDVSERTFQRRGSQWTQGKSHDHFGPLGPWLLSADQLRDPHTLRVRTLVNGQTRQDSNTSDLIFNVPHILAHLAHHMTLMPGDVITSGTPSGVAAGMNDAAAFLKAGDELELSIDGLGVQRQRVVPRPR